MTFWLAQILKSFGEEILKCVYCIQSPSSITTVPVKIECLNIRRIFFQNLIYCIDENKRLPKSFKFRLKSVSKFVRYDVKWPWPIRYLVG